MVIQEISRDAYIFLKILIDFSHLKDSKSFLKIFRDSETLLVTWHSWRSSCSLLVTWHLWIRGHSAPCWPCLVFGPDVILRPVGHVIFFGSEVIRLSRTFLGLPGPPWTFQSLRVFQGFLGPSSALQGLPRFLRAFQCPQRPSGAFRALPRVSLKESKRIFDFEKV